MLERAFRVLALAGILVISIVAAPPARAADPVDIDVVTSLTGPGTFLGKAELDAINALQAVVNREGGIRGRPVKFVFHDDQTSPQVAVQLMNEIKAKKVPVMIGGTLAATCLAMAPLVKNGPVQYCFSPAIHPAAGSYTFSGASSTKDALLVQMRYYRARGWKRLAMITSTDASGQDADVEVANALALPENENGVVMVDQEHFNGTDLNVAAQMARIKAAKPQVLLAYAPGTPFGVLLRGIQNAGIDIPIATGNANMSYPEMKQYADILPKQLYMTGVPVLAHLASTPAAQRVQSDFYAAFKASGIKPDFLYTVAWDPALIVVDALKAVGPNATAEEVQKYIEGLHGFTGVSGVYDFRDGSQRGLSTKDNIVMRWEAAKNTWIPVSDAGALHALN